MGEMVTTPYSVIGNHFFRTLQEAGNLLDKLTEVK